MTSSSVLFDHHSHLNLPQIASPPPQNKHLIRNQLIKDLAKTTLIELAVGLTLTGIACAFVATPLAMASLVITTIAIAAINLGLRCLAAKIYYTQAIDPQRPLDAASKIFLDFANWMAPYNFSILSLTTSDVVIHEAGHALAVQALYANPRTKISLSPFLGGLTKFSTSQLSKIGEWFGRQNTRVIVAGAGPAAGILAATIEIGLAHKCKRSHPRLSKYLTVMGCINILNHMIYALSALEKSAKVLSNHDFIVLWRHAGIHPAASAVAMVALPIIVKSSLFLIDKIKTKH